MKKKPISLSILLVTLGSASLCLASDRTIKADLILEANLERVWNAWTTPEGVKGFFAPGCNIDLRVDGLYEIFFDPQAEPGKRGADGMRILALEPMKRLSFTWSAPTSQPYVRRQRTHVTLFFDELGNGRTRLRLSHGGWGEGEEWDRAFEYFMVAWKETVLPRLEQYLTHGPVDWESLR